jgi:hypothetical protein
VRDSEPLVPEDRERREQNRLLAEKQKLKKDAMKRKRDEIIRAREALEKRHRQQACDGLPREESPSEPESDGEDLDIFSDEEEAQGFRGVVPPQGAPARRPRPQGSLVPPEERAGVWPLGPYEMTVLREGTTSAPRPKRPEGILTLPGGGGDASE